MLTSRSRLITRCTDEQISKLEDWYEDECDNSYMPSPSKTELQKYVVQSLMMHRNLIEQWGGLTRKTKAKPLFRDSDDDSLRTDAARQIWYRYGGGLGLYYAPSGANYYLPHPKAPEAITLDAVVRSPHGSVSANGIKVRKGQRFSSAIGKALLKGEFSNHTKNKDQLPLARTYCKARMDELCSKLGTYVWTERKLAGILSVEPYHFLKLGHYGENNSCYREGKSRSFSKRFLGARLHDSFVLLWRGVNPSNGRLDTQVLGRAWGWKAAPDIVIVSNFYLLDSDTVSRITGEVLEEALEISGLRWDHPDSRAIRDRFMNVASDGHGAYINGDCRAYCSYRPVLDHKRNAAMLKRRLQDMTKTVGTKAFLHGIGQLPKTSYKFEERVKPIDSYDRHYFTEAFQDPRSKLWFRKVKEKVADKILAGGPDCPCKDCQFLYTRVPYLRDTKIDIY